MAELGGAVRRQAVFLPLLKQPPALPVRLSPSRRLHLDPIAASTRVVRRVPALRNNTFEPMAFGRPQQSGAVFERFDQVEAWKVGSADQAHQPTPAFDQREWPEIFAVAVQEIEGEEHEIAFICGPNAMKVRRATLVGQHKLPIEQRRAARQLQEVIGEIGQSLGPILTAPAVQAHLAAILGDLKAVPVELDLVLPSAPIGDGLGRGGYAGSDKVDGHATGVGTPPFRRKCHRISRKALDRVMAQHLC